MERVKNLEKSIYSHPKYFGGLEIIEFIIFFIIVYKYNPFNISTDYPLFTQFFILIAGFVYVMLFLFIKNSTMGEDGSILSNDILSLDIEKITEKGFLTRILSSIGIFIAFIGTTIALFWLFRNIPILISLTKHSLSLLIIIGFISIIYLLTNKFFGKLFGNIVDTKNGSIIQFIKKLLLFLPCLFIKFVEYAQYEFNITSKPVWVILVLEIVLIGLWYVLPKLFNYTVNKYGNTLLKDPVYLNKEHTLGTFESLHLNTINSNKEGTIKSNKFNYHYSLSAWFYINPQPPNTSSAYTQYTSILNYGNKPNVQYNGEKNSLRIMTSLGTKEVGGTAPEIEIFETNNILYQKWNHIVINYDGGNMDVFLNGELVGSKPNIAPYMTYENVISGHENGIHGGICNVVYYDHTLSNSNIKLMYKLLRDKEFPTL